MDQKYYLNRFDLCRNCIFKIIMVFTIFIEVLTYNIILVSDVQQNDSIFVYIEK